MRRRIQCLMVLLVPCLTVPVYGEKKGWSLLEVPVVDIAEQPATEKETRQIRTLIKELAQIDAPDVGYSPTMCGECFSPVPASEYWSSETVVEHNLKRSEALKQLVAFGPKALPFLLESLKDKTPTKFVLNLPHGRVGRSENKDV